MRLFKKKKNKYRSNKGSRGSLKKQRIKKTGKKKTAKRKKINQQKTNWKKKGVLFLWLIFLIFVGWVFLFSGVLYIENVKISGVEDDAEIRQYIQEQNERMFLGKIPQNNLLLFSANRLKKWLKSSDIRIQKVDIKKAFPDSLEINIQQRKNIFLWKYRDGCLLRDIKGGSIRDIDCQGKSDKELLTICQDEKITAGLRCLVVVSSKNNKQEEVSPLEMERITGFIENLDQELKKVSYFNKDTFFEISNLAAGELVVHNNDGKTLLIDTESEVAKIIKKLKLFLDKKITATNFSELEYIDLRIENKIIYKMRQSNTENDEKTKNEDKNKEELNAPSGAEEN